MPIKSIKNIKSKINNLAEGEILGDAAADPENLPRDLLDFEFTYEEGKSNVQSENNEQEDDNQEKPIYQKKEKVKKEKVKLPNKKNKVNVDFNKTKQNKVLSNPIMSENLAQGYQDILNMLNIKPTIEPERDLNVNINSDLLDYVEFTQTYPVGFDFDEVTYFIARMKYTLQKLEQAIKERNSDVIRLASEVKKVEEKMIAQNQEKELERMIGGMTEEERLIEENMDLKVEVNELTRKLANQVNQENGKLLKEIEALKVENDILKKNLQNKLSVEEEIEDTDIFSSMLEDIGGMYDE